MNQFFDLDDSTVVEVGLVFQHGGPGTGAALMDRGRLVWAVDPDTGECCFRPSSKPGRILSSTATSPAPARR